MCSTKVLTRAVDSVEDRPSANLFNSKEQAEIDSESSKASLDGINYLASKRVGKSLQLCATTQDELKPA